jgi:putative two-component system response regulator
VSLHDAPTVPTAALGSEPADARGSVLIVDDEPQHNAMVQRVLTERYNTTTAPNCSEARALMNEHEFDLIVLDIGLPDESGIELQRQLPGLQPDAAVIVVTGSDDVHTAEITLGFGAYGYLVKPFRQVELLINVSNAMRRRSLELAHRDYTGRLEHRLIERTTSLNSAVLELESERLETLHRLSLAVEARDRVTADHIEGMIKIVRLFARKLGYSGEDAQTLGEASAMHDVGKIGVADEILLKPGPLTNSERSLTEQHAEIGHRMLDGSKNPLLQLGADIAWAHHERWDGAGYPRRLSGTSIPIAARIVQIVDVFSAITTDRPYREALPLEIALRELGDGAGTQFDPRLIEVFLESFDELLL